MRLLIILACLTLTYADVDLVFVVVPSAPLNQTRLSLAQHQIQQSIRLLDDPSVHYAVVCVCEDSPRHRTIRVDQPLRLVQRQSEEEEEKDYQIRRLCDICRSPSPQIGPIPADTASWEEAHHQYTLDYLDAVLRSLRNEAALPFRPRTDRHFVVLGGLAARYRSAEQRRADARSTETDLEHRGSVATLIKEIVDTATLAPTGLTFVHDTKVVPMVEAICDPRGAVTYADGSHFQVALTLSNLIALGSAPASTLQAHLLNKGITASCLDVIVAISVSTVSSKRNEASRRAPLELVYPWSLAHSHTRRDCLYDNDCPLDQVCCPLRGCTYEQPHKDKCDDDPADRNADNNDNDNDNDSAPLLRYIPRSSYWNEKRDGFWSARQLVNQEVDVLELESAQEEFAERAVAGRVPLIIRNSVTSTWRALNTTNREDLALWLPDSLRLNDVKEATSSNTDDLFYDTDTRSELAVSFAAPLPYIVHPSMSAHTAIAHLTNASLPLLYAFERVPPSLRFAFQPNAKLFLSPDDEQLYKQFVWLSSARVRTHTHVDQDHNFFVQLYGVKRFTLFMPDQQDKMCFFPRTHPMWHKASVDFRAPNLSLCPGYAHARTITATLAPGDVLYVPPFTFHHVETLSPSASLSTWSHDMRVYEHMTALYKHEHKFDMLASHDGKRFALRLFLDLLLDKLYGRNASPAFFRHLLQTRFLSLPSLIHHYPFHLDRDRTRLCDATHIPTAQHVIGDVTLDAESLYGHLSRFVPETRDILTRDYVEELILSVVGLDDFLPFMVFCFLDGQTYRLTDPSLDEHATLWQYK